MVGARGFEPPTSRSRTVRATKLRYAPKLSKEFIIAQRKDYVEFRARPSADDLAPVRFVSLCVAKRARNAYFFLAGTLAKHARTISMAIKTSAGAPGAYFRTVYPVCILAGSALITHKTLH